MWSGARLANVALGLWLFLSAFLWPHTLASQVNTSLLALVIVSIAAAATPTPVVRAISTVPAIWLLFSSIWISDVTPTTMWHNAIVAGLVLVFSLVPTRDRSISVWP
jgi:hypothetical protein